MSNISGFSIDDSVTFTFNTGGSVPGASGCVPANAALLANPTPPAIIAVAEMEE